MPPSEKKSVSNHAYSKYIEKQRMKEFGHFVRMQTNQISSRVLHSSYLDTELKEDQENDG
jgi:hypothetical protein